MNPDQFKNARRLAQDLCSKKIHDPLGDEVTLPELMKTHANANDELEDEGSGHAADLLHSISSALKDYADGKQVDGNILLLLPDALGDLIEEVRVEEQSFRATVNPKIAEAIADMLGNSGSDIGESRKFQESLRSINSGEYFNARRSRTDLEKIAGEVAAFVEAFTAEQNKGRE